MHIEDVMTRTVKTCGPEDMLAVPARLMWENDVGCVPVTDEQGRPIAMLTDRDICMAALMQGRGLGEIQAKSAMSGSLHCVALHDPLAKAERMMQEFQVRRLPVVDAEGRVAGLLSMNDIAREAARERPLRQRAVTSDDVAATLASICRPRVCVLPDVSDDAAQPAERVAARMAKTRSAAI